MGSVKQLSLPTTSSEAEQVADHQPQAQELPGQDAAPGCRQPSLVQVELPAVMAMFEPIPVWPYRLGGLAQDGEMRWVTGRWTAWTRRGGWWRTLDTHDSSKEGSR